MSFFELIIAHHTEDLAWLKRVPKAITVTVYHKPGDLPNVGREAHTYLHHLVERYDTLADVTVFCQGKPFDHAFDFHKTLRALAEGTQVIQDFAWFGHVLDTDTAEGKLFQTWSKNENGRGLNFEGFYEALWGEPPPDTKMFALGAQFAVTRACVHRHSRKYYAHARALAESFPDAAHCFERTWDQVFGVDGILPQHRAQGPTVYLKPIKRLMGE
jgi:hypothetical protein